jgi:hypothetical protein
VSGADAGRTVWWAKDSGWWRRERIVELGEEFGAAGPAVIDWLSCEAKAQNDGGVVKAGYRTVARGCFVELVTVRHVLSRAVQRDLLHDFTEADGAFTCHLSGWAKDQERGRAAARKAAARDRANDVPEPFFHPAPGSRSTRSGKGLSRSVTPRRLQDRTEQKEGPPRPPASGGSQRRQIRFAEQVCAWAREHGFDGPDALLVRAYEQAQPWKHNNGTAVECFNGHVARHFSSSSPEAAS